MNPKPLWRIVGVTLSSALTFAACGSGRIPQPVSDGISDDPDAPPAPGAPTGSQQIPDGGLVVALGPPGSGTPASPAAPSDLRFVAGSNSFIFAGGFCNGTIGAVPTASKTSSPLLVGATSDCIASVDPQAGHGQAFLALANGTTNTLGIAALSTNTVTASAPLAAAPSVVRVVSQTEAWVSESQAGNIEVFTISADLKTATRSATIATAVGAVGLEIDVTNTMAYTSAPTGGVIAISTTSHQVAGTWATGCASPGGITTDSADQWVFAGCKEGTVSVLNAAAQGALLGTLAATASLSSADSLAFDPASRHLYIASGTSGTATVAKADSSGGLTTLGSYPTESGASCIATDYVRTVFTCSPSRGGVLFHRDLF